MNEKFDLTMIKDIEHLEGLQILKRNYIGRLGYSDENGPNVLPITYFFDVKDHSILSYASEGHKINAMRKSPNVSLLVDEINTIKDWKSVLVHGTFEELSGSAAKKFLQRFAEGVQDTIAKRKDEHPKFISDFSIRLSQAKIPIVYRIKIRTTSGKFRES